MTMTQQLSRYAGRKATRRLTRAIPWIGAAIALVTLGSAIRRKGFVGGAKNLAEAVRGRDFIPDRAPHLTLNRGAR